LNFLNADLLDAVELNLEARVRERPGFQEEEQLGLEIVVVVGNDEGASASAAHNGLLARQCREELVDGGRIADMHHMLHHYLIATERFRRNDLSAGPSLVGRP
jgi:hypothetical protein